MSDILGDRRLLPTYHALMELPDYWLPRPGDGSDPELLAAFDRAWDHALAADDQKMLEVAPEHRWQLLCHLADSRGVVLHGSGRSDISVFVPRQANDLRAFGNQEAVYAAGDGLWAMFFAIVDRDRVGSVSNACIRLADATGALGPPQYQFSVSRGALPNRPWRSGTVYVLPSETFELQPPMRLGDVKVHIPQLASFVPVRPLARVAVEPADFPFLSDIRGHDDDRLEEYTRAMETFGPWPDDGS